MKYTYAVHGL